MFAGTLAAAVACQQESTEPDGGVLPSGGEIRLVLDTPNSDDRAILLTVAGPAASVEAAPGFTAFTRIGGSTMTVVLVREAGESIASGGVTVATIRVEASEGTFQVELSQVATRSHAVRSTLDGYSLSLRLD